jgi:hypothetical protein
MDHPDDHAEAAPAQVLGDEHQDRSDHGLHGEDISLRLTGQEQTYAANNDIINSITDAMEAQESRCILGEVMLHQATLLRLTGNGEEEDRKREPTQEKDCGNHDSIHIVTHTLGELESPLALQYYLSSAIMQEDNVGRLPETASNNGTVGSLDDAIRDAILEKVSPELLPTTEIQSVSMTPAPLGPASVPSYPGAIAVAGFGMPPEQPDTFSTESVEVTDSAEQHETPRFNATLVEESSAALMFAHATAVDAEADENALLQRLHSDIQKRLDAEAKEYSHWWRRPALKAMMAVIVVSSVAVIVMAATGVFAPPYEERPTKVPSMVPSLSPAPSATLLTFLAERSIDGGEALATVGSPQQRAGIWLEGELSLLERRESVEYNYRLVQTYALATLYYATSGNEWDTTRSWLFGIDSCTASWIGLFCNKEGEVTTLIMPNKLNNGPTYIENNVSIPEKSFLIPAEIGLISTLGTWKAATHSRNVQYRSRCYFCSCSSLCTSVAI